ncbi:MAG: hypothetical protein KF795_10835, partial [Labilithrix sp.]|nr:hypothetical protein [Labilithrix sp.]
MFENSSGTVAGPPEPTVRTCARLPGKTSSFCPSFPAGATTMRPALNAASIARPIEVTAPAVVADRSCEDGSTATRALRVTAISSPLAIEDGVASRLAVAMRIG